MNEFKFKAVGSDTVYSASRYEVGEGSRHVVVNVTWKDIPGYKDRNIEFEEDYVDYKLAMGEWVVQ